MSTTEKSGTVVPWDALSPEALNGVIESFVLREGTEYGEHEFALDEKVAAVRRQLERGDAGIVFDPSTGSIDIVETTRDGSSRHSTD